MRGLWVHSRIRSGSSIATRLNGGQKKFGKLSRATSRRAMTKNRGSSSKYLTKTLLNSDANWYSFRSSPKPLAHPMNAKRVGPRLARIHPENGHGDKFRGPFYRRGLRIHWRMALAGQTFTPYTKKSSSAAWKNAAVRGLELIDWTMQKAQQLRERHIESVSQQSALDKAGVIETLVEIISSPAQPLERSQLKATEHRCTEHVRPFHQPTKPQRPGDRSLIASPKLELAITEAVKKAVPGCEAFAGVFVQRTSPKSRFDANWALRGVKFGRADRERASEAIAAIVERMQQEYKISDD
jgi:hypothetical protein